MTAYASLSWSDQEIARGQMAEPRTRLRRVRGTHSAEEADFLHRFPSYAATQQIDELRAHAYRRLDACGAVYLDYTGGSLHAETQLHEHLALLNSQVFGNPHSINPTSLAATELVEQARADVLAYLNASPDEYTVVFTSNASAALKLVGESYPFARGGQYLLTADNHNSVNGIREFARAKGAPHSYVPLTPGELRIDEPQLDRLLSQPPAGAPRLFAYPAQSNFSGVQHSLAWIARAQALGWDVLLDCAAFAPTNRLDLSQIHPDFVTLSFYKLFGYPTGIGALVARRAALRRLRRPWFAGGTVVAASVVGDGHALVEDAAAFEDGTVNYLHIPAITIGLHHLKAVGIGTIHTRVGCLTAWLLETLRSLRHRNGAPLVTLYGPAGRWMRGGTIALNFLDSDGQLVDYHAIERHAAAAQISLRTGCFCNPGASEHALGLTAAELTPLFHAAEPLTAERYRRALGGRLPGAVRISLGLVSNFADAAAFAKFARGYLDQRVGA